MLLSTEQNVIDCDSYIVLMSGQAPGSGDVLLKAWQ